MRRLVSVEEGGLLRGLPELWTAVLDRLAADVQLESPAAALRQAACRQAGSPQAQIEIQQWCFDAILHPDEAELWFQPLRRLLGRPDAAGPLRHVETQLLLAADHLAEHLRVATRPWLLDERLPPAYRPRNGPPDPGRAPAIARLRELLLGIRNAPQAMAAGLLHAAGDVCPPRRNSDSYLAGAYLSRVRWPRLKLKTADWNEAQLRHADLRRARIGRLIAFRADLTGGSRPAASCPIARGRRETDQGQSFRPVCQECRFPPRTSARPDWNVPSSAGRFQRG